MCETQLDWCKEQDLIESQILDILRDPQKLELIKELLPEYKASKEISPSLSAKIETLENQFKVMDCVVLEVLSMLAYNPYLNFL